MIKQNQQQRLVWGLMCHRQRFDSVGIVENLKPEKGLQDMRNMSNKVVPMCISCVNALFHPCSLRLLFRQWQSCSL